MSKVQSHNYLHIQGWMITELGLSGNELLTYAIIYGFSQENESEYTGSLSYLCSWLGCSKPTAIKTLSNLIDKNLIIKTSNVMNGVTFNRYKISLMVVKNLNGGGKEILLGGGKEILPNNKYINNKIYNKLLYNSKSEFLEKVFEFESDLGDEIQPFINYWTEENSNGKMRVNSEKFFDLKRRISTWMQNSKKFKNNSNFKQTNQPSVGKWESSMMATQRASEKIQEMLDNGTFKNPFNIKNL